MLLVSFGYFTYQGKEHQIYTGLEILDTGTRADLVWWQVTK